MAEQINNTVIFRPPSTLASRRCVWLLPILLGFCLLPAYQLTWHSAYSPAEKAGPSQIVVDALRLAIVAPAATALSAVEQNEEDLGAANSGPSTQLQFLGHASDRDRAIDCLAVAAWYEAGNDFDGQRSVMQVVLNRVAHPSFPKSVCGVVFDGSHRATGCQFTFTCDGSMARRRPSPAAMARARAVAALALESTNYPGVGQATHYHADYVLPWWSSKLVRLGKIGPHIFYRWPGTRGTLSGRPSSISEAKLADLADYAIGRSNRSLTISVSDQQQLTEAARPASTASLPRGEPIGGNTISVAPAAQTNGSILLAVDRASPSGRWAVSALGKCAGQTGCRVLAYELQERYAQNGTLSGHVREKPIFIFVRDASSGIELALWDCEKVARPVETQCLPSGGQELARLLRESKS